jgi:bifunctional DNase/RNase
MPLAKVDFFDLRYDHKNDSPVLFLKDAERDKFLPVWIGALEANSIELAVMHKRAPRPLTHDLITNLLHRTGVQLLRVIIDKLEARTYFATLHFEQDGEPLLIDCRPSDAIAIALRENVRIYVEDGLMYNIKFVELTEADVDEDGMGLDVDDDGYREADEASLNEDVFQNFLRNISPTDFREG